MSLDMAGPDTAEPARARVRPGRRTPPAGLDGLAGWLLRQDVLGVRLGVLLLILPMFVATLWLQIISRGALNHPPDSRYYLPMISQDMGHSLGDAVQTQRGISPGWKTAAWYFADDDPSWQMVRSRLLYPFLSVPFAWVFGVSAGSLAVPILADIAFFWVMARILQRLHGPAVAVIVVGALTFIQPIFNVTWAGTDTLSMALAAVIVANLPIDRPAARANLAWLGLATVLVALTRQVGVLAPAMAGAGWLWALARERSWRNRWLGSLVVTSVATLVLQVASMLLVKVDAAGIVGHGQTTIWGVLRQFTHEMKVVTLQDISYMWHFDRVLLALFAAALVAWLSRIRSDAAAVFLGAAAATYAIIGGVGFSSAMRYEMILFPAVAVMAGSLVASVVGDRSSAAVALAGNAVAAEASVDAEVPVTPEVSATPEVPVTGRGASARRRPSVQSFARQWGRGVPRSDRWVPQATFGVVFLALLVGVSAVGGARSSADAPPSPSFAAAQGGQPYAVQPLAEPTAASTLKTAFQQFVEIADLRTVRESVLDWTHAVRYRPTAPGQPAWGRRAADGTTVTGLNGMIQGEDYSLLQSFAEAVSVNATVLPDTVRIVSRQTSAYGEDVVFTVQDKAGVVHRGTATTLYPMWNAGDPGLITSLVFES